MLSLKNIVVHYGGVEAVKGISIDAEEGSITTLIGANGAGKSTCLRAISRLIPITSGEIWFEGKRIDRMKSHEIVKLGIAHVPEGKRLFQWMSTFDNLMSGAYLRKDKPEIQRDLKRAYEYFPILSSRKRQQAKSLSGGEQQMLAFGRALLANPKIFLFDEPSLGLAPILVRQVMERIKYLAEEEGYTVILVEQNAALALEVASKAYVLETGKIALEGDAKQLQKNEHVKKAYLGL
ncbi:ABC transporter ATP-binding protein [Chloroflexota bacterium]